VVEELDPSSLRVSARVNGEVRQEGHTSDMLFPVPALVAYISSVMTLEPDDVILTGTPPGVGPVRRGDIMEVEVEGIGVLRNRVV
jgi:2-keto-4-pentenoate hydratase/2-oxohepta-3-ene-1,7-dioic acid hydratase in catechol pathway